MRGSCCGVVFSIWVYVFRLLPTGQALQIVHRLVEPRRCWVNRFRRAVAGCWVALILLVPLAVRASEAAVADPPAVADDIARRMQDREYAAAVEAIDQALARPDESQDYLLYLKGRALLLDRQFDAAVAAFEQLGQQMPDSPWNRCARFATGLAAVGQADFQRAATVYRLEAESLLAPERKHELAEILLQFGDALFHPAKSSDKPDYAAALRYFEEALKVGLLPDARATTQFRAARCRQELKEHARAAEEFTAFATDHPDNPLAIEATFRAGQCLLAAGKSVEARRAWYGLLDTHPDSPSEWIAEAMFHLSRTWGLPEPASDADLELGVETLELFLTRFPAHERAAQARLDIAVSYLARKRDEDGVRQLTQLLADPQHQADQAIPQARRLLGQAYRDRREFAEAIQVWREYLVQHPADPQWSDVQQRVVDAEYLLALDKYRAKDYPAASQLLAEFLAKYPLDHRCAGILVLVGRMKYEQQQWNEAIADWQAVVSKYPQTNEASYAQTMIGLVTERELGQPAEAIEAYRQVTRGDHAREAQAAIQRLTAQSLTVVTERVFRSDEIPAIRLTTRNIPTVTVRVYRIDAEAYFRKSQRLDGIEDLDIALIAPDATFEFPVPDYAEFREFENVVPLPQPELAAGALVVTVGSETLETTTLVLRSDLEVIVKASPSEVFVLAQNMRTGKPWPGARLLISDGKTIADGPVTGDDGVCRWDRSRAAAPPAAEEAGRPDADPFAEPAPQAIEGGMVSVLALADGHVAANALSLEGLSVTRAKADRGYLVTDRPAYQPGQRVFVRGCIRIAPADAERAAAGEEFSLQTLDPRGRIVWQQPVRLGPFRTFAADFPLPRMGIPGTYRVVVRTPSATAFGQAPRYEGLFQVVEYRAEPVRLRIEFAPRR
jgi:alpha-2-macroglobulin